jgi:TonB family protein
MTGIQTFGSHASNRAENLGRRAGIAVSLIMHGAAIAAMLFFSLPEKPRRQPPPSTAVTLAVRPDNSGFGKTRKAPVAGRKRSKPAPSQTKVEPKREQPKPKPANREVGLNREQPKRTETPPREEKISSEPEPKRPEPRRPEPPPERPQDPKLPIARGGIGGEEESGISLDMGQAQQEMLKDGEFLSYMRLMYSQIARRWTRGSLTGGVATIRFQVDRDGSISEVTVLQSAGESFLDGPAKRAVMGAELPPLPQGFREDALIVNVNFHYDKR